MSHPRPPAQRYAALFSPAASAQRYHEQVAARTTKTYQKQTYQQYSSATDSTIFKPEDLKYAEIEKNMTSVPMPVNPSEKKSGCCYPAFRK